MSGFFLGRQRTDDAMALSFHGQLLVSTALSWTLAALPAAMFQECAIRVIAELELDIVVPNQAGTVPIGAATLEMEGESYPITEVTFRSFPSHKEPT
jgi:hypothetical protein